MSTITVVVPGSSNPPEAKTYADQAAEARDAALAAQAASESARDDAEDALDEIGDIAAAIKNFTFRTLALAKANTAVATEGATIYVQSRTTYGDNYHGSFAYVPGDTTTAYPYDGLGFVDAIGQRWARVFEGNVRATWYGMVALDTADRVIVQSNLRAYQQATTDADMLGVKVSLPKRAAPYVLPSFFTQSVTAAVTGVDGEGATIKRRDGITHLQPGNALISYTNLTTDAQLDALEFNNGFNGNTAGNPMRFPVVKLNGTASIANEPLLFASSGTSVTLDGDHTASDGYIGAQNFPLLGSVINETITGLSSGSTWKTIFDLAIYDKTGTFADTDAISGGFTGAVLGLTTDPNKIGLSSISAIPTPGTVCNGPTGSFKVACILAISTESGTAPAAGHILSDGTNTCTVKYADPAGDYVLTTPPTPGAFTNATTLTSDHGASIYFFSRGGSSSGAGSVNCGGMLTSGIDAGVWQQAHSLQVSPAGLGWKRLSCKSVTVDNCIGSGIEPKGTAANGITEVDFDNVRGNLCTRSRKTWSITNAYDYFRANNCHPDLAETEPNGVGTTFKYITEINGGIFRSITYSNKNFDGTYPDPLPVLIINGVKVTETFSAGNSICKVSNSDIRMINVMSARGGELHFSETDFTLGATFNAAAPFSGNSSGSPHKVYIDDCTFRHETGAVMTTAWFSQGRQRAGDEWVVSGNKVSSLGPFVSHASGAYTFLDNEFEYTGGAHVVFNGGSPGTDIPHFMVMRGNRPKYLGTSMVLWSMPTTAPSTGAYTSWKISFNNPAWPVGKEVTLSDPTKLVREGGTILDVQHVTRWEDTDRPITAGTFFFKGQIIDNKTPKANGYGLWRCMKSGDPTTRAQFYAEAAGANARYSANDNFMQPSIDTNRWAFGTGFKGSDGNVVDPAIPSPNAKGGVFTAKSGKSATGTVAVNAEQLIDKQAWYASQGGFSVVARLKCDFVTNCIVQFGVTDQNTALEEMVTLGSSGTADTIAGTPPDDMACLTFDTSAFNQKVIAVASKATVDSATTNTTIGLANSTSITLQIDIDSSGNARFFVNDLYITTITNAVTPTVALYPTVLVSSKNTTQKTLTVDYINAGIALDMAA